MTAIVNLLCSVTKWTFRQSALGTFAFNSLSLCFYHQNYQLLPSFSLHSQVCLATSVFMLRFLVVLLDEEALSINLDYLDLLGVTGHHSVEEE